jgi:hypothetical protein
MGGVEIKIKTCLLCCECYHGRKVGTRICLSGHWDERDPHKLPRLNAYTMEPEIPQTCTALTGDSLLNSAKKISRRHRFK